MTALLQSLIEQATVLGDGERCHQGRVWRFEGGRPCPIGWEDCSQAVYVDDRTGQYDHGEAGGPGLADCHEHCEHRMEPPEPEEPFVWLEGLHEDPAQQAPG